MKRFGSVIFASVLTSFSVAFASDVAKADQSSMLDCIRSFTQIGVSADAAMSECNKKSLAGCVQQLLGKKFEAVAIKQGSSEDGEYSGYLIDLGNDKSRWMEGKQWKEQGCMAYTKGPYHRQSDRNVTFWSSQRSYEWFRQGWCGRPLITLEQPYSVEEAKVRCELGVSSMPTILDKGNIKQPENDGLQ